MNENIPVISYAAHEGAMTRMFGIIKRLIVAVIISVVLLVISNGLWLYAWMQYDYSSEESTSTTSTSTVTIDGKDGVANYIGNNGDITNGKDSGEKSGDKNTNQSENKDKSECQ